MNPRVIPWINAIGCLVLVGLLIAQWRGEHLATRQIDELRGSLAAATSRANEESARCAALERDLQVLKEAAEKSGQAVESGRSDAAAKEAQIKELEKAVKQAGGRVEEWRGAIAQRDERIRKLEAEVTEAKRRLSEAVGKLKAAGAR